MGCYVVRNTVQATSLASDLTRYAYQVQMGNGNEHLSPLMPTTIFLAG